MDKYVNYLNFQRTSYVITVTPYYIKPRMINKKILKTRIKYTYLNNLDRYSELWFQLSKYSDEELNFVDELFNNLDEDNLAMIKGVLHSKTKSRKYERK